MAVTRQRPKDLSARRAQIFRTAAHIFRDRGFDGTSVGDVARALRMTKAGLYHYFTGKEALLFEILSFGLDQVRDEVAEPARKVCAIRRRVSATLWSVMPASSHAPR